MSAASSAAWPTPATCGPPASRPPRPARRCTNRVRAQRTKVLIQCLHGLPPQTSAALLAAVPDLEALAEALKPPAKAVKG